MAHGRKKYKLDPFAVCDKCGRRVHKEDDRHYQWEWLSSGSGFDLAVATGVYCRDCDYKALVEQIIKKAMRDYEAKRSDTKRHRDA